MSVASFEIVDAENIAASEEKLTGALAPPLPEKTIPIYTSQLSAVAAGLTHGDKYASMIGIDFVLKVVK
jgi:hypothetical protein